MNARKYRLATLAAAAASCAALLTLGTGSASAAVTHKFIRRLAGTCENPAEVAVNPEPCKGSKLVPFERVDEMAVGPVGPEEPASGKSAVFVADHDAGVVDRVSSSGTELPFECVAEKTCEEGNVEGGKIKGPPGGRFGEVAGVAVDDETGEIYVSDATGRVYLFAASGQYVGEISGTCENPDEVVTGPEPCKNSKSVPFGFPAQMTVDQKMGELYVVDKATEPPPAGHDVVAVYKLEPGGKVEYLRQFGAGHLTSYGSGTRQSVAVAEGGLEPGTVYVGNRETAGSRQSVDVFSALGTFESEWRGERTLAKSFGTNFVVAGVDPVSGHVYAVDASDRVVDEFAASTSEEPEPVGYLRGTPAGLFTQPTAVAVVGKGPNEGDLWVADFNESVPEAALDEFGPDLEVPEVKTEAPSEVKPHSATLNGTLSTGKGGPASCTFVYGTATESLDKSAECEGTGSKAKPVPTEDEHVPVSAPVNELLPDTKYYYRLQASYTSGEEATNLGEEATTECEGAPSEDGCFTTPGPGIVSTSASEVYSTSVTLHAMVNPHNGPSGGEQEARESWYFQYGTGDTEGCTPATCTSVPVAPVSLGEGEEPVPVEQHVQDLSVGTVYHYRVVAVSEPLGGPVEEFPGPDQTFTTQSPGSFSLIDGRAWEMVSPPNKQGALVQGPGEPWGVTQAAAQGGAMTWLASVPTEEGVPGFSNVQQVLSTRGTNGWVSKDLATPHNGGTSLSDEAGQEYRFFNEELTEGILNPFGAFQPCRGTGGEAQACLSPYASEQTAFEADLEGTSSSGAAPTYTPLATGCPGEGLPCETQVQEHADVPAGTIFGQHGIKEGEPCPPEKFCGPYFDGASPDADHIVLRSFVALTPQTAPEGGLYEYNAGQPPAQQLQLISLLPGHEGPEGKPSLGTETSEGSAAGFDARHAISDDGSRVFWTSREGRLYMRDVPREKTIAIGNGAPGGEGKQFQLASSDGSRVFFSEDGRLYECEITEALECEPVDLGEAPPVNGRVIGASEDGSYVYWVAADQNLYVDHYNGSEWQLKQIAALSSRDEPDWADESPALNHLTARVSPDGQWLAFMSSEDLTGYDNQDALSGQSDEEAYLYHAPANLGTESGTLACASCNPTGARPTGAKPGSEGLRLVDNTNYEGWEASTWLSANLPGWVTFESSGGGIARYQPRYLSNEGRVFFDSDDALVPKDINGTWDVYEYEPEGVGTCTSGTGTGSSVYEPARTFVPASSDGPSESGPGCIGLISSGESSQESVFLDASESGGEVFFMTTSQLSTQDFDTAYDIYDAHECTSESPCIPQPPSASGECVTAEACRVNPIPEPDIYGAPASATFNGVGHIAPPPPAKPAVPKKKTLTRAQKLAKALKACRKDRSKSKAARCEKAARRKYGVVKKAKKGKKGRK